MKEKKKPKNYIDNEKLYQELIKHRETAKQCLLMGKEKPRFNDYIGKSIMDIAENLSHIFKFQKYPFRDEMIFDAVLNVVQYLDNFDPERSNNPFSYISQICYYAFIRRIEKEKKYLYTKFKSIENEEIFYFPNDSPDNGSVKYSEGGRDNMNDFIEKFEAAIDKKKTKTKE